MHSMERIIMKLTKDQDRAVIKFNHFVQDGEAFDAYITGQAGTGKTTVLGAVVQYCIDNHIPTVVCAYTHKAKEILIKKLPFEADVRTLHSFLRKRPGINEEAKSLRAMQTTSQFGKPEEIKMLIVDEYSMVGESDAMSIGELQDPDYEGMPKMKVLYVGDERQLPPVGQPFTLQAGGDYVHNLTEVQRQGAGPLLDTICDIVDMIDGKTPIHKLEPNEQFHRDVDIIREYTPGEDSIVLAYTNRVVEQLNKALNEKMEFNSLSTNIRWSPSLRKELIYISEQPLPLEILTHSGMLLRDSKYKTLEHLVTMPGIQFGNFQIEGENKVIAYVFGHYQYKMMNEKLAQLAADSNAQFDHANPKSYCQKNPHKKECRARAKAWRDYLTFKECVMCVDFPYAQTIHKSQGSTFEKVYIDNKDLKMLLGHGKMDMYLKLLYVAVSRASDSVYMS